MDARKKALSLLAYGPRSKEDLYNRLLDKGFPKEDVREALAEMEALGFVNDGRLAADYVAYAIESKAYGQYRIIRDLVSKGIDETLAERAYKNYLQERREQSINNELDEEDVDLENAVATLEKRMERTGLDPDDLDHGDIRRLSGYLERRGFSFDVIDKAFERVRQ